MVRMRRSLLLLLLALALPGCEQKPSTTPRGSAPASPSDHKVILSTTVAPGSPFKMSVSFDPAQPLMSKKTTFRLALADLSGAPVSDAKVQTSLVMPLMDMGKNEFALAPKGNGSYQGSGQFTMSGEWEVVFTASAGGKSGKTTFNVRVED